MLNPTHDRVTHGGLNKMPDILQANPLNFGFFNEIYCNPILMIFIPRDPVDIEASLVQVRCLGTEQAMSHCLNPWFPTQRDSNSGRLFMSWGHHIVAMSLLIARFMGPTWAHLGPTEPRWAPCWPHELCYLGNHVFRHACFHPVRISVKISNYLGFGHLNPFLYGWKK